MATATGTSADLIEAAKALAPQIEACREESERERSLPKSLVRSMAEAGLFRVWVPKSLGGLETDVETFLRVIEEVSKADGAAGWNVMIAGAAGMFAAYMPPDAAREIFGDPNAINAGAFAPKGRAVPESGGYRVTGRWPLASGCQHAAWLGGGCLIFDGGAAPRMGPSGLPDLKLMFAPVAECKILDTWYSAGLRGTGSHDFEIRDLLIPEERTFSLVDGNPCEAGVLYRAAILDVFGTVVSAVSLGIARAAIDTLTELAGAKVPAFSASVLKDRPTVQAKVAEAEALVRSARAFLYETVRDAWATVAADEKLSEEQRVLLRLAPAHAAASSAQAVDIVYTLGGATSVYTSSKLERCFRDVHVVTQHIGVSYAWYERTGQYFLGKGMGGF